MLVMNKAPSEDERAEAHYMTLDEDEEVIIEPITEPIVVKIVALEIPLYVAT